MVINQTRTGAWKAFQSKCFVHVMFRSKSKLGPSFALCDSLVWIGDYSYCKTSKPCSPTTTASGVAKYPMWKQTGLTYWSGCFNITHLYSKTLLVSLFFQIKYYVIIVVITIIIITTTTTTTTTIIIIIIIIIIVTSS